jgi:TonB family protein
MRSLDGSGLSPKDQWVARGASMALHALLFGWLAWHVTPALKTSMVVFSVETVSGLTPLGEGSGAQGANQQITNVPANLNPLAGGLNLKVSDPPVPAAAKPSQTKPSRSRPAAAAPSLQDLQRQNESLPIGLKPRHSQGAEEPSEGGMGNAHQAGVEGGVLGLQGAIAGRGYNPGDYSYGKPLPGESEVVVALVVGPKGEVLSAQIKKTSGYPELDMHALAKAREVVFDALPPGVPQEPASGTVRFKFEYSGKAIP